MLARMSTRKLQASVVGGLLLLGLAGWLGMRDTPRMPGAAPAAGGAELALQPAPATAGKEPQPVNVAASAGAPGKSTSRTPSLTAEHQQLRERVVSALRERERERKRAVAAAAPPAAAAADEQV